MTEPYYPREITCDMEAEKALAAMRSAQADYERMAAWHMEQLRQEEERLTNYLDYLNAVLERYFDRVPHHTTRTQESYQLPSGKLVRRKRKPGFALDNEKLLPWVRENAPKLIRREESVDWAGLKKGLILRDGRAVDPETGEVVPGILVEERPDRFEAKINDVEADESERTDEDDPLCHG